MAESKRKYTEARKKATMKWESANIYKTTCKFPIDWKDAIKEKADQLTGGSVSAYIKLLVENDLNYEEPIQHVAFEDAP